MPSKDLFTRFARSMRDGVCRCTAADGRILFANRAFAAILGRDPAALAGKLLHEVCRGLGERGVAGDPLGPGRGVHGSVYRLSTLDGRERRVLIDSFVAYDPAARARVATLIARDVTARGRSGAGSRAGKAPSRLRPADRVRDAGAAPGKSEAKYRALVEQIPAITYIAALDDASTTLFVSPQIEMIGFTADDYREDPDLWRKRIHPDDRARVLNELTRGRSPDRSIALEYRMVARDGRVIWIRDEGRVVRDAGGEPLFLQGVMFDITERRRLDEELKRSAIASRNSSPRGPASFSRRTSVSARARRSTAPSSSTRTA